VLLNIKRPDVSGEAAVADVSVVQNESPSVEDCSQGIRQGIRLASVKHRE